METKLQGNYSQELTGGNRLLKINPKFRDIIPPLDAEEYENLRESLKTDGCRDAIIIWDGVIIDGHNRHKICVENGIPFRTLEKSFADEDDAAIWIIQNQICRRNLSDLDKVRMAAKVKDCLAARAKENQILSGEIYGKSGMVLTDLSKPISPINTRQEIAKITGVSEGTIAKIEKVNREAPAPIREAMGKAISIDKAARFTAVLKEVPEAERETEARRLLMAEYAEAEAKIYREEKMVNKLFNMISAAALDYEYISEDCVDVYIKQSPIPVWDIAKSIDGEIEWLLKLKEMVLRRGKELEGGRYNEE